MHHVSKSLWMIVVISSYAGNVEAQTPPKPLPAPQIVNTMQSQPLLLELVIQKEIGLSEKQIARLHQIEMSAMEANQAALNDPGEDGFDFNAMMGTVEQSARQKQVALAKVLTPAQRTRLQQIELQREGWLALGRTDVARKVKLTPSQTQKVQAIVGKMRQAQTKAMMGGSGQTGPGMDSPAVKNLNPGNGFLDDTGAFNAEIGPVNPLNPQAAIQDQKSMAMLDKIRDASMNEVNTILTADQRSAFDQLLGPAFDFGSLSRPVEYPNPTPGSPPVAPKSRKSSPKKPAKGS